ncbi:MAG: hypothetical protein HC828_05840 [Blastochloris sp.]|nr:hypothetical protein [Blastochloris sp.]
MCGFGRAFYEAYEATWPTAPDRALRRDVYNLYHLLNHLNLFGTMYSVSIDQVLSRYV